jgi:DNA adenine methylase
MVLQPFFCRTGSKVRLKKKILPLIPQHEIYTEAFIGGGAIFWNKEEAKISVINDKDETLIKGYELLKKSKGDILPMKGSLEEKNKFIHLKNLGDNDELLRLLYLHCNTFGSKATTLKLYKNTSGEQKLKKLEQYRKRLKEVKIHKEDYKSILEKYDSVDTFHYLDPPYMADSDKKIYKEGVIPLFEFSDVVKKLKGKWLISLNDSEEVRNAFKDYDIISVIAGGNGNKPGGQGFNKRKEVLIKNY